MKPLAIDLFCGLGGWTDGLLAEGYYVVGFDIEQHVYGDHHYPAQLVLQDVLTLHGSQFRNADLIVASPPCQEYSYMAMPWSRAKQIADALKGGVDFPANYAGSRSVADLTRLFDACFRIKREACEAASRDIPLIIENVQGAQRWLGRARWSFGSYYLWGDVPALMPVAVKACKVPTLNWSGYGEPGYKPKGFNVTAAQRVRQAEGVKTGGGWFGSGNNCSLMRQHSSKSDSRKFASAMIAKIPLPLSRHIARTFLPAQARAA